MAEEVYCTLLMSDSYLPGAAVLARSLRDNGTEKKLAVLVTPDSLLQSTLVELRSLYDYVLPVDRIANQSLENLVRLDRLDLRFAFTKIALWKQIQFKKITYLDADVVTLRAPDELFKVDSHFAAAPDIGWPDIFNSGVMVLAPSMSEYWSLHTLASSGTSFDGADQGLLNEYFGNRPWHRLSFAYNCTPNASYQYEPAYRHFRHSISMVHFIGKCKPWTEGRSTLSSGGSNVYKELLGKWWSTYDRHYRIPPLSAHGPSTPGNGTVQRYVSGEQTQGASGWAATGQLPGVQPPPPTPAHLPSDTKPSGSSIPHEVPLATAEFALTELLGTVDGKQGVVQPTSTSEQRRSSTLPMQWDATRDAPPMQANPEASNFPGTRYEMSRDRGLFHAPQQYPAPPGDLSYLPSSTEPPKPIFPWETNASKPTRVFADDLPSQPTIRGGEANEASMSTEKETPPTPAIRLSSPSEPWQAFTRTNAWDDNESINQYVRAFKHSQQTPKRDQVHVLHNEGVSESDAAKDLGLDQDSPPLTRRRESLILTDFPTADDRPSLPVTPAPVHRQSFWGEERNHDGKLPAASGVPEQAEWNPTERLETLRRSSLIATDDLPQKAQQPTVPQREHPSTSMPGSSPPLAPEVLRPLVHERAAADNEPDLSNLAVSDDMESTSMPPSSLPSLDTSAPITMFPDASSSMSPMSPPPVSAGTLRPSVHDRAAAADETSMSIAEVSNASAFRSAGLDTSASRASMKDTSTMGTSASGTSASDVSTSYTSTSEATTSHTSTTNTSTSSMSFVQSLEQRDPTPSRNVSSTSQSSHSANGQQSSHQQMSQQQAASQAQIESQLQHSAVKSNEGVFNELDLSGPKTRTGSGGRSELERRKNDKVGPKDEYSIA